MNETEPTSATTTKTNKAMDKELEQLCEELELAEGKERAIFRLGFTLGFMEGMIAGPPPHRPSCKFPDAETR